MRRGYAVGAIALLGACSSGGAGSSPVDGGGVDATIDGASAPPADGGITDAGADAPPVDAAPGAPAVAMKKIYVGDTERDGGASTIAWKSFGRNIDGKVTTSASTDVCKPVAGAGTGAQIDGDNGIDNAFGSRILPIIQTFASNYGQLLNQALTASTFNFLTRIDATPAFYGGASALGPAFDGTDKWPVTFESVDSSDVNKPKVLFPQAAMNGQDWSSGDASAQAMIVLPLFLGSGLPLKVNKLQITMTLAADGKSASSGMLSGVMPTADFVAAFRQYAPSISTSFCSGSAIDSIVQQLQQASDILTDGTQDPAKECDGISVGLGFDGARVSLANVAGPVNPPANLCE